MDRDDQRYAAGRALMAKALADLAAEEVKASRRAVEPTLVGGEKVKAVLPDGTVVGHVQLTEAPVSVVVTDERALLDYVKRTRPDEVLTREYIRESFLSYLKVIAKAQLTASDHGEYVVDKDGEVIPGLELDYGSPRYVPSISPAGRRAIHAVLARLLGDELAGRLALTDEPRGVEP